MSESRPNTYDLIPYPSDPFPQTHPDRLSTIATLFGLNPTPVTKCRVLELGCASGGNLLPMAMALPESDFVGVDLSPRQVADGQAQIEALGVKNLTLKAMSITDVDESFGQFDYILCHGVYSWVPPFVQDRILDVCGKNLSPNGVAYISYNTYPGWHMRGMIRDMMSIHTQNFKDPVQRIQQARALLDFLAKQCRQENTPYGMFLKQELELLSKQSDAYLFHEHLEENNAPIYFYQFVERFQPKGLRYLGEADFCVMLPTHFSPEAQQTLRQVAPQQEQLEQYMDFLRNRMFRQTLLIRAEQRPNYTLHPDIVRKFAIASPLKPEKTDPDLSSTAGEAFKAVDGRTLTTSDPIVKAAITYLSEIYPRAVPYNELVSAARLRIGNAPSSAQPANAQQGVTLTAPVGSEIPTKTPEQIAAEDHAVLSKALLSAYATAFTAVLEFRLWSPHFETNVTEKPVSSPLIRHQARRGNRVTNAYHHTVTLSDFDRQLVQHLNGQHDKEDLVKEISELVVKGVLNMQIDGKAVTDKMEIRKAMKPTLEQQLPKLARAALLIG